MRPVPNYGHCPTCGQSLVDETMRKRVERAQATAKRLLSTKLRATVEADVTERLEAKYAAENARAKARADELQRQLNKQSAHDRGVGHEQDVLASLRSAFPIDRIERHGRGGDILHTVKDHDRELGQILYECKNAGTWQNAWLAKLKQDGRRRGTPYLVLVTRTLPARASDLLVRDDVAICGPANAVPVAAIVRQWVVGAFRANIAAEDVPEKARRLYEYLAGSEFRGTFSEILDCANKLAAQDANERTQHERAWQKRASLYGRLRAAHVRIGARLESELVGQASNVPTDADAVLDLPRRNRARRAA